MNPQLDQFRTIIYDKTSRQPPLGEIRRVPKLSMEEFKTCALNSTPVIMTEEVADWPILRLTPEKLKEEEGDYVVKVRVGDYVTAAFSPDREFRSLKLREYIDWISKDKWEGELPPYVGNNDLPGSLKQLITVPRFYPEAAYLEPRLWLGPKGATTALHYDFADNLFVQIWGSKRFIIFPPHQEPDLYTWDAGPSVKGSRFDPENPDYEKHPLSRKATPIQCDLKAGEMLFLPGLWFHYVRSLELSLSINFFVGRIRPLAAFPPGTKY